MSYDEAKFEIQKFFQELDAKQQAAAAEMAKVNEAAGQAFLAENGKRPEVTTTASGLQYEVLAEGAGQSPAASDQVVVHYTGKLIDGTVFDSSVERGEPATFGVTQVIPGWVEALQMMKPGAKWRVFIPSNLAYGPQGAGGVIGPNATLIFDVELLSVVGK
jgi:FKBP-type peptidyl-prolyl cis-trans isomerase FklB